MPRNLYQEYAPVIQRMFQENGYSRPFAPGTLLRAKQGAKARIAAQKAAEKQAEAAQKLLEQAALQAARARAAQQKSAGDSLDTDIANKEFRLKNAGVDPNKDPRNWLEKALNLPKKQNWFLDTLDVLNRPLHGLMNAAKSEVENIKSGKSDVSQIRKDLANGDFSQAASDLLGRDSRGYNAFKQGVSGHADTTGSDVLGAAGVKNKYVKGIGGFAADVAFDPMNLVPVGLLGDVAKGAFNVARKVPLVDKGATATSKLIRPLFDTKYGKDATLQGTKDSDLLNLERKYINNSRYYKDKFYTDSLRAIKNTDGGINAGVDVGKALESDLAKATPTVGAPNVMDTNALVKNALANTPKVKTLYNPAADLVKNISVKSSAKVISDPEHLKQVDDLVKEIENTKNMYKDAMDSHVQEGITPHLQKESEWHALSDIDQEYQKVRDQIGKIDIPAENRSDWTDQVPHAFKSGKNTKRNTDLYAAAEQMGFDNVDHFVKYLQDIDYAHKAIKGGKNRFMNLGFKETPTKTFKLPKDLKGAKPRYGYQHNVFNLNFKNDLEKALYITTNKGKSLSHDAYMAEIKRQTGLTDAQIADLGQKIRDFIKGHAKNGGNGAAGIIDIPDIAKLTKTSPKGLSDIEEELRQQFHLTDDAKAMRSVIKAMQTGLDELNAKTLDKVAATIAVEGSVPEGIAASLIAKQPVEQIAKHLSKNPAINRAAKMIMKSNEDLRKLAKEHGIHVADLEGYMAHVLTDEAKEALDKMGGRGVKKIGGDSRVLYREIHDSVENINKYMSKKYGIPNFDFFNPNAFFATTIGQQRMVNYIMAEGLKKEVLSNPKFAMKYEKGMHVPKGAALIDLGSYSFAKDGINKASDITGKYIVTDGAKSVLDNYAELISDKGLTKFFKTYDAVQGQWKKLALFSVGFHARNLMGNMFNMYVRGMKAPEIVGYNTVASKLLSRAKKGLLKSPGSLTAKEKKAVELYDEFKRQGLKEMSAYDVEFALKNQKTLTQNLKRDTSGKVKKLVTDLNPVNAFKTSRRVGETADEANRLAMYLWARKSKNLSPEKAANIVRESLFDYSNITATEKAVFKRLFPFWTWMRNNIQYQVTQLVKNPAAYSHLGLAVNDAYQATGTDKSLVPDWMQESLGMPIVGKKNGDASLFMPNLPAADLSKLSSPAKTLLDSATPLLKTPAELITNKNFLTGAPIQSFAGQTKDVLGQKVDSRLAYAINQLGAVRNLSGNVSNLKQGNLNPLGSMIKPFDKSKEEKNQKYAKIRELDAMQKKFEQDSGSKLPTVKQYEDAGVYRDKQLNDMTKYLKKKGFSSDQQQILMVLYKKVVNNGQDYADKVRQALEQQGLPQDVIDKVTADYLVY